MMNFLAYSTNVPSDIPGQVGYGLGVTAIGVIIVFAVLILIMLVIYLFQGIFGQKPHAPKKVVEAPVVLSSTPAPSVNQEELIVVLAAAVAAQEGCDPASSRYRIRSFRRIL